MAVNQSRSLNGALAQGMSDNSAKKLVMDRGGIVEDGTWEARSHLGPNFDIREEIDKPLPDGTHRTAPLYGTGATDAPVVAIG
jgi:hypothetical protein